MVQETEKTKTGVIEQRIKPTVIRRRAKKAQEPAEADETRKEDESVPLQAETAGPQAGVESKEVSAKTSTQIEGGVKPAGEKTVPTTAKPAGPTEAGRKIGLVGYIDLGAAQGIKVKEDWRERGKRGARKKKSREELEMDAIQRVGGLKHYAEEVRDEISTGGKPDEPPSAAALGERIFQPVPSGRRKKIQRREFKKTKLTSPKAIKKIIRVEEAISVSGLSQALGVKAGEIIKRLLDLGITATINQNMDVDTAMLVASEHGFTVEHTAFKEEDVLVEPEAKVSVENLSPRAPVVTVMGHVDHGKTSILDVIREANVAAGEMGGITQHIGAYEVRVPKGKITFLDTPGHEAFTMMRARGAQATDIVILVVAADDGIMPQTIEAIDHAKAAEVPIVVAINKIDKANAQPDRVKKGLSEHGLVPEEWGGDTICVQTSAKTRAGIAQLLEMVLLQAEMLDLKVDRNLRPKGVVIEARLDRGQGPVATVLVQEGTLKPGHFVVCGTSDGKIRAMFDAEGNELDEAGPSKPVSILGLSGVPAAGDEMIGVSDERSAKLVAEQRREKERRSELRHAVHVSLEDLSSRLAMGDVKELNVILKADVQGSVEAVSDALAKLSTERVGLKILHTGVGGITESDVLLASASDAVIFGFNVQPDGNAMRAAVQEGVDVRCYRIIYEMIDEVIKAMEGLLAPEEKEVWLGRAEVRDIFRITKVGTIAGCFVVSGKIQRSARVRLLRDQVVVFEGKISSLRRFKDDAREVAEGLECGIGLENFGDLKPGDVIEAFVIEKKAATL